MQTNNPSFCLGTHRVSACSIPSAIFACSINTKNACNNYSRNFIKDKRVQVFTKTESVPGLTTSCSMATKK